SQLRLNQNSMLQIKTVADAEEWQQTQVKLHQGRAWSHARPTKTAKLDDAPAISMETPTATLSIRGTVWLVDVSEEGTTSLVVLSGLVDLASEQGKLSVASGEAARVERGKAPVKFQLTNPRDRVQWVTPWRPDPARWLAGKKPRHLAAVVALIEQQEFAQAGNKLKALARRDGQAARLLADLHIYMGELKQAIALLAPHAREGAGDPLASALLGQALLMADEQDRLRALLEAGLRHHPEAVELRLLQGRLALFDGQEAEARAAFAQVIEQHPDNPRGWLGLGVIEAELEDYRKGRAALHESLQRDAELSESQAELATLETKAGNLAQAEQLFQALLSTQPDDFIALAGQGMLRLKQGRPREALDAFLRSGLVAPDYARGWFYSGVAFYQLGEADRAIEAFRQASVQDDKDPLPHLIESRIHGDRLDYGRSIAAAQKAMVLMPNLKSLNQLANDQRGSANLGKSLADFGMEAWANRYAIQSYSPYWAGSHFFMADRYTGLFTKNSELFKGFITDPTAFGGSNRFSNLVLGPGHYARMDLEYIDDAWPQATGALTLNGFSLSPLPFAYFARGILAESEARDDDSKGRGDELTLGLGSQLNEALGLFAFATDSEVSVDLNGNSRYDGELIVAQTQHALGMNIKVSPRNQLWLKLGEGELKDSLVGEFDYEGARSGLTYLARTEQKDVQFRQALDISQDSRLSWGLEYAEQYKPTRFEVSLVGLELEQSRRMETRDAYVSLHSNLSERLALQLDLYHQELQLNQSEQLLQPVLFSNSLQRTLNEWNPRIGLQYQLQPTQVITLVGQSWRRPASVNTLGQVDTLGIAVNDWLVSAGGKYERARLQYDGQFGERQFLRVYADQEKIDNLSFALPAITFDLDLESLKSLQNKQDVFTATPFLEAVPSFDRGEVSSLGLSYNRLLSDRHSIALDLVFSDHQQTGQYPGLKIPYVADFKARLASHWSLPNRWLLGAAATYRSERFEDGANEYRLADGWSLGMLAHWESADKRLSLQAAVDNILSDKAAGMDSEPHYLGRMTLRF
ncbi:MAG: tetratricopeptide repeat protein, partial [Gammaproteobacteria bacterium]|nr:tetratricopeptide repeat protein [Gammaproteobacteria bacterium]